MNKNRNDVAKFALGFGITGIIAGLFLILSGKTVMGVSSSIASVGIAYYGFSQLKKPESSNKG